MRAILASLVAVLALAGTAQAKPYADPAWRDAPAWTSTVPAYGGVRAIPSGVCPFGISDLAAYRGSRRLDRFAAFTGTGYIVNAYYRTIRVYVWCG